MDHERFDALARALAVRSSRRQFLHAVLGVTAGGLVFGKLAGGSAQAQGTAPAGCGDGCAACCSGTCVDTGSDPNNCGGCGNGCPSGQCSGGVCVPAGCSNGLTNCNGSCIDTSGDPNNCGGCGNVCQPQCAQGFGCGSVSCTSGLCVHPCPVGTTACCSTGCCIDLTSDPQNCGGCGTVCPSGQCANSTCVPVGCPSGQTSCNGSCIDTSSDPNNCGGCGNACGQGQVCLNGVCQSQAASCPPGQAVCVAGFCTDLQNDDANCGSCGNQCPSGSCQGGQCLNCPSGTVPCNQSCQQCCTESDCPVPPCTTPVCTNYTCASAPLSDGTACQANGVSGTCQGGQCLAAGLPTQSAPTPPGPSQTPSANLPGTGPSSCAQGQTPCGSTCCDAEHVCARGPNGLFCGSFFCLGGQPGPDCAPTPTSTPGIQPAAGHVVIDKQGYGLIRGFITDSAPAHAVIGIHSGKSVNVTLELIPTATHVSYGPNSATPWAEFNKTCPGGDATWNAVFGVGGTFAVQVKLTDDDIRGNLILLALAALSHDAESAFAALSCSTVENFIRLLDVQLPHLNQALLITTDFGDMLNPSKVQQAAQELLLSFTTETGQWLQIFQILGDQAKAAAWDTFQAVIAGKGADVLQLLEAAVNQLRGELITYQSGGGPDQVTFVVQ